MATVALICMSAYRLKNYKEYIELISHNFLNKTPSFIHSAMLGHYLSFTFFSISILKVVRERCRVCRCMMGLELRAPRDGADSQMSLALQRPLYFIYMNGFHKEIVCRASDSHFK